VISTKGNADFREGRADDGSTVDVFVFGQAVGALTTLDRAMLQLDLR